MEIDEESLFSTVCLKVDASKYARKPIGTDCLHWNDTECECFQLQIVIWIETWGHHFYLNSIPVVVIVLREIQRKNLFKSAISGKSCGYMLLVWERCYECEFLTWRTKVNSDCFIETTKSVSSPFHFYPAWNVSALLLPCDKARPHISVGITETITKFWWGVLPQQPYSCKLAPSDFSPFWSLERWPKRKQLHK